MADHTVKPGDCFNLIAKKNGFFNYQTLYNHADNAALKKQRPNPNMLVENDVVKVPDKKVKKVAVAVDKEHKFVLDRRPAKLRLSIADMQGKALKPAGTGLEVGADSSTKKPSGGLIELTIDPQETAGTLKLTLESSHSWIGDSWRKFKGSVGSIGRSASFENPPGIDDDQFEDEFDAPKNEPVQVAWTLQVGALEPAAEVRGVLQRLNNLGFGTPVVTVENQDTARTVRAWQAFRKKPKDQQTGKVADVRSDVEKTHDQV